MNEEPSRSEATRMRTALLFTLCGLIVQAFCLYELTPGSFLVFALVAVPMVGIGLLVFAVTVWRVLRETRGL
jgi:hypothetical protein